MSYGHYTNHKWLLWTQCFFQFFIFKQSSLSHFKLTGIMTLLFQSHCFSIKNFKMKLNMYLSVHLWDVIHIVSAVHNFICSAIYTLINLRPFPAVRRIIWFNFQLLFRWHHAVCNMLNASIWNPTTHETWTCSFIMYDEVTLNWIDPNWITQKMSNETNSILCIVIHRLIFIALIRFLWVEVCTWNRRAIVEGAI